MSVSAKDIQVLEGISPVRERPGMYIGPTNTVYGLFNWAREPIDNVIDEWAAGRNTVLLVKVEKNRLLVADQGIGIPVEKHPTKKIPTLTLVFTTLHAGAKFSKSKAYKAGYSTGMHGVGVSVTNALSLYLEVYTYRNHRWWYQRFERGEPVCKVKNKKPPFRWPRGTVIIAEPDPSIFRKQKIPVDLLEDFLHDLQYLCPGLKIRFNSQSYYFRGQDGLKRLLLNKVPGSYLSKVFSYADKDLQVALVWAEREDQTIYSFVNYLRTCYGGTHVEGLKEAVLASIRALEPQAKNLSANDLLLGFAAALHVHTPNPSFDSQTKERLDTPEVKEAVKSALEPALRKWWASNKAALKRLVRRAKKAKEARARFREEVVLVKKAQRQARRDRSLPAKLLVASGARPEERELFIVEGDSALVSGRAARDRRYQEVLPIRGKTINLARVDAAKVVKNEEFMNIIKAIGAGFGDSFRLSQSRVGKVLLLTDADPDGLHIRALLLTFFVKFMRPLVDAGCLYVVEAPLYVARKGSRKVYGNSLDEVKRKLGTLNGALVTRMKGWAEASADDLKEIAMDPAKRFLWRVRVTPQDEIVLERVMGPDSSYRKLILLGGKDAG